MKKLLFFAALVCIAHSSWAGKVTLPGDLVLIKRLEDHGFGDYAQKTDIVEQLEDKEHEVSAVLAIIDSTFADYRTSFNDPSHEDAQEINKSYLIHALLVEHKQAYDEAIELVSAKK